MEFPTADHSRDVKVMVEDHNCFNNDQAMS